LPAPTPYFILVTSATPQFLSLWGIDNKKTLRFIGERGKTLTPILLFPYHFDEWHSVSSQRI
jgi:hypothetical protein